MGGALEPGRGRRVGPAHGNRVAAPRPVEDAGKGHPGKGVGDVGLTTPAPATSRAVDVRRAVASRRRAMRGAALTRVLVVLLAAGLVMWVVSLVPLPGPAWLPFAAAVLVIYPVSRWTATLRNGRPVVASVALACAAGTAVAGVILAVDRSEAPGALAGFAGMADSIGGNLDAAGEPFGAGVAPGYFLPALFFAAVGVWASRPMQSLRAIPPFRGLGFVRWCLIVYLTVLVAGALTMGGDVLLDVGLSDRQVGGVVLATVAGVLAVGSLELLRRGTPPLPPGRLPTSGRRRSRVWTGRSVVVVPLLVVAAVTVVLLALLMSRFVSAGAEAMAAGEVAAVSMTPVTMSGMVTVGQLGYAVALVVALQLLTQARRRAALDASRARERDGRPFLLYLRSFRDDEAKVVTHSSPRHTLVESILARRRERFEEVLVWHLWRHGPVTAVGHPRERLPRLGAAREYLSDEEWQATVGQRIRAAAHVVVVLGRTRGLAWEMGEVRRAAALPKVVLVVPPVRREELAERWRVFDELAAQAGWPVVPLDVRDGALTLTVDAGSGAWRSFRAPLADEWAYEVAVDAALRPPGGYSGGADLALPPPWVGTAAAAALGVGALALAVAVPATGPTAELGTTEPGTCLDAPTDAQIDRWAHLGTRWLVRDCDAEHTFEVGAVVPLATDRDTPFPGDRRAEEQASEECLARFEEYVGSTPEESELLYAPLVPDAVSWAYGHQSAECLLVESTGLTRRSVGSLRGSGR